MIKRVFISTSAAAGAVAFIIFRKFTHPLELALDWLFLFLPAFTFLSGLGVFGATRIVFESQPRSADDGGLLYGDTFGIQMLVLDHDLWFYVVGAVTLPLALLLVVAAIAAFKGIPARPIRNGAA